MTWFKATFIPSNKETEMRGPVAAKTRDRFVSNHRTSRSIPRLRRIIPNSHIAAFWAWNTHLVTVDTHDFAFLPIWGVMEARHHPMFTGPCMHNGINEFVSSPLFGHGRRSTANPQTLRAVGISWSSNVVTVEAPPSRGVVLKTFTYECSHWGKGLPVLEVIDSGRRKAHASSVWRPGRGSETLLISLFIVFNLVLSLQHHTTLSGTTNDTQIHSCKITVWHQVLRQCVSYVLEWMIS